MMLSLLAAAAVAFPLQLPPGARFQDCADCPELVVIAPGQFAMGHAGGEPDRPEGPTRLVTLRRAFALGRFEVTVAQFAAFVADTGYSPDAGCNGPNYSGQGPVWIWNAAANWRNPAGDGRAPQPDEPVTCVSWRDSQAYVQWLSRRTGQHYRLPTEAEWEFAARAGSRGEFPWGDDPDAACTHANVFDLSVQASTRNAPPAQCNDGHAGIAPVGAYAPNAWQLHDMIGNVWEWVEDCYEMPYPADGPVDGSAQVKSGCDRHGSRGGSWISAIERQRPTFRGRDPSSRTSQIFGFRVARDLR